MCVVIHLDKLIRLAIVLLVYCHAGHAQGAATTFQESEVKAAIEDAAVLHVCPDQALLALAELEVSNCENHIAKIAPLCWNMIDKVVPDYEFEQSEEGKEKFISFLAIYVSCVRAEFLGQIVESSRETDALK